MQNEAANERSLVALEAPRIEIDPPRDMVRLGQPYPPGTAKNDPTQALKTAHTPGVTHSHPPNKECEHGSPGRLPGKTCEHAKGNDPQGLAEPTFAMPRFNTELLTSKLTQNFEASPNIMKLMRGAKGLIEKVRSVGERHSDNLQGSNLEEPREKMSPTLPREENLQESFQPEESKRRMKNMTVKAFVLGRDLKTVPQIKDCTMMNFLL